MTESTPQRGQGKSIAPRQGEETNVGRRNLVRLIAWLGVERPRLVASALCCTMSVLFALIGPLTLARATNIIFDGIISKQVPAGTRAHAIASLRAHGQGQLASMFSAMHISPGVGVDFTQLGKVVIGAIMVYVLSSIFAWAQNYIMAGIAMRAVYRLREAVAEKIARLPLRYFDSASRGDILSRVTNDIDNITTTLREGLSQLLTSVLTVIGVLTVMFLISPLLAVVSMITIPSVIAVTSVVARRSKKRFVAVWHLTGRLNGLVEETHTGHDLVRVFGRRPAVIQEFDRQNGELCEASFRAQFLSGLILPAIQFVTNLNYVLLAVVGGYQVAVGIISLGAVQAFIQYSRRFTVPVAQIASQMNLLQSGLASAERVFAFLDVPEDLPIAVDGADPDAPPDQVERSSVARRVELQQVSFRYDPVRPLIEDFSLEAAPGQTVAIVGPTGAGKTTIVNLLMRFYEIDSGRILLDGVDYSSLSRDQVRSCFGMVLQDTWLFTDTIRENIAYGKEGASGEEVVAAAKAAHVDHFVRTLPDGYDTILDGNASSISAGQKQLLTIARAFLVNPGILLLDEATSNVDTRTEVLIQDAMTRLRLGRTSFVIAHRLSTIHNADTIIVMDDGRIVEQGNHEQLLGRGGCYYELYSSQFSQFSSDGLKARRPVDHQ